MASHEIKVTMENEEKQVQLAQKVLRATFEQIKAQVQEDMVQLKSRLPGAESQAVETAKDLKHMRDRQQTLASSFNMDWLVVALHFGAFGAQRVSKGSACALGESHEPQEGKCPRQGLDGGALQSAGHEHRQWELQDEARVERVLQVSFWAERRS